ncbi:hypothetical protein D3C85_1768840 [compost metagenome]
MVGRLKNLARSARANTLFLNASGSMSRTRDSRPAWWSTSRTAASSLFRRLYLKLVMVVAPKGFDLFSKLGVSR